MDDGIKEGPIQKKLRVSGNSGYRRRPLVTLLLVMAGTTAAVFQTLPVAQASFHIMLISEVFPGTVDHPDAQYVELQMQSSFQNLVNGHKIFAFQADGTPAADFGIFQSNVANNANKAYILMATPAARAIFGIASDANATGTIPFPSGRICFAAYAFGTGGYVDCVAYGAFTGSNTGYGTPAVALQRGQALTRIVFNFATRNNANDFQLRDPTPTNNAGQTRDRFHDVAVTSVVPSSTMPRQGETVSVAVSVKNHGYFTETFTVTARFDGTVIGMETVTLAPSGLQTVLFLWDTTGISPSTYTLSAEASAVTGENFVADNSVAGPSVCVFFQGDVDKDGAVNFIDLGRIGAAFLTSTGQPGFDADADVNNDGAINFLDLGIVGSQFLNSFLCTA